MGLKVRDVPQTRLRSCSYEGHCIVSNFFSDVTPRHLSEGHGRCRAAALRFEDSLRRSCNNKLGFVMNFCDAILSELVRTLVAFSKRVRLGCSPNCCSSSSFTGARFCVRFALLLSDPRPPAPLSSSPGLSEGADLAGATLPTSLSSKNHDGTRNLARDCRAAPQLKADDCCAF